MRPRGFTLVEVVVALAILVFSLTALYATFESASLRAGRDAKLSEAVLLAQSLLARAGTEWPLQAGQRSGEWGGYEYTLLTEPLAPAPHERAFTLPAAQITAVIAWRSAEQRRSLSLSTLKLMPAAPQ